MLVRRHAVCSHRMICTVLLGDSTSDKIISAVRLTSHGKLADIIITDPPYCILERRRKLGDLRDPKSRKRKVEMDPAVPKFESVAQYSQFSRSWLNATLPALKTDGTLIVWTNGLGKRPVIDSCSKFGFHLLGEYIWAKYSGLHSTNSSKNELLLRVYESALVFRKERNMDSSSLRKLPWSVITNYHDKASDNSFTCHEHPCHKPLDALEPLLLSWTKPGDLILDPFAGAGGILSATMAIEQRDYIGIETLEKWVNHCQTLIANRENQQKEQ